MVEKGTIILLLLLVLNLARVCLAYTDVGSGPNPPTLGNETSAVDNRDIKPDPASSMD